LNSVDRHLLFDSKNNNYFAQFLFVLYSFNIRTFEMKKTF